jgi:hypothetical protein
MARVYREPVEVRTGEDGRPAWFGWRGRSYTVRAVHEYWLVNRDWWRESRPVQAQPELEFWRVEAAAGPAGPVGAYELRREVASGAWTLRRVED